MLRYLIYSLGGLIKKTSDIDDKPLIMARVFVLKVFIYFMIVTGKTSRIQEIFSPEGLINIC